MSKQRKIKLTITIEHLIDDDWYEGEGKTPSQKLRKYEEEFGDIEVLDNHVLSDIQYGWDVKAEYYPIKR